MVKDVILLPGPRVKCVPKGVAREELYVRGFTTTFDLSSSMNEKEIRAILEEKLKYKLGNRLGPKCIFVRAVSNKIIVPTLSENERFDGRMIKHFAGQGPVYIRALRDISSTLTHGHWKRLDPDSSSSGEESEENPGPESNAENPGLGSSAEDPGVVEPNATVLSPRPLPSILDILPSGLSSNPSTSSASEPMSSRNFVSCPTCHNAFPAHEIELHADACAEKKYGSVDENQYNSLMASFVDSNQYEDENMFEVPSVIDVDDASESLNNDAITHENHKEKIRGNY